MKIALLIFFCVLMGLRADADPTVAVQPGCRLTVELRDGSRVVGQTLDDTLSFHSATVGDIKLAWAGIRTVEYTDDTDAAHLTAANGDAFVVQLSNPTLDVQTGFGKTELPVKLIHSIKVSPPPKPIAFATPGSANGAGSHLTIILRDGSRLVGKGLDDTLNFHSTAMGDLKLTWAGIRSIVYEGTADSAQLTAANGDVYAVQFVAATVRLETSFGKSEVPVKFIRSISASNGGDAGEHLIGWWRLDDGSGTVAKDSSPSPYPHDGTLMNGPAWMQDPGPSEMSLQFNGRDQHVSLGNALQGKYEELSIACWVKHAKSGFREFIERNVWDQPDGIAMAMSGDGTGSVLFGHYQNNWVQSKTPVQDGHWHHIVGTIAPGEGDASYVYKIYVDGKLDNTALGSEGFTATATNGLGWSIGARNDGTWAYDGLIGDVRIYDHALSADEVEAIYAEQSDERASRPDSAPPSSHDAVDQ